MPDEVCRWSQGVGFEANAWNHFPGLGICYCDEDGYFRFRIMPTFVSFTRKDGHTSGQRFSADRLNEERNGFLTIGYYGTPAAAKAECDLQIAAGAI